MTCKQASGHRGQRVRRQLTVLALAAAMATATALPAAAGGWWSYPQLEHDELAIGEPVTVTAEVLFPSTEHAEEAAGPGDYFAYLVRGIDAVGLRDAMSVGQPEDGWWATPTETTRLAPLELGYSSNFGRATARFVVPEVEPGIYDLMLCTTGCSEPLADVVPLQGIYVGDAATVHALRNAEPATERLLSQVQGVRTELGHLRSDTQTLETGLSDVDATLVDLNTSVQRLTAGLAALEHGTADGARADRQAWWTSAAWFIAGVAAAGAAASWVRRRRAAQERVGDDEAGPKGDTVVRSTSGDRAQPEPELVTFDLQ